MEGNKFGVSISSTGILILMPPTRELTKAEALEFSAWIVVLTGGREKFLPILDEVESS